MRSVKSRFGFFAQTGQCNTKEVVLQRLFLHISFRYLGYGFTIYLLKFLSLKISAEWMCPLTTTNFSFGCYSDTWITVVLVPYTVRPYTGVYGSYGAIHIKYEYHLEAERHQLNGR